MQSQSFLSEKKVSIRKQRRKQQIQTLFASKRKLLLSQYSPPQVHSLVGYFELLAENQSVSRNLRCLSNLLAEQHPFDYFHSQGPTPNKQQIQQFCINLCELILKVIIKQYRTESKQDIGQRIACLTVISNLLADKLVENHVICGAICSFLKETYCSVQIWGVDKELVEVGWLIGNLIGKEVQNNAEEDNQYVLQWIQELIVLDQPGLLVNIYRNLGNFITSLQKKHRVSGCVLPEVHTSKIINILTTTIHKNISTSKPLSVLIKVMQFLNGKIFLLLSYSPKSITQAIISQIIPLIGFVSSQLSISACHFIKVVVGVCDLQEIAPRQRKVLECMQKIRVYIVQNYSAKLMQYLLLKQIRVKRQLIKFMQALLRSPTIHINYVIALLVGAGLEQVLATLSKAGDNQLLIDILHLAYDIQRISEQRHDFQFISRIEAQLGYVLVKQKFQSSI